jgi:hypothetical protein
MPSHRSSGASAPEHVDDLTRISGIGSVVAGSLEAAGIRTFGDVEASTPEQLAAAVVGVRGCSAGRIESMDWIGQARRLGSLSASADVPSTPAEPPSDDVPAIFEVVRLGRARIRPLHRALSTDQPIAVGLELRPGPGSAPAPTLDYSAEISARRLDADGEVLVVRMTGVVRSDQGISHAAAGPCLKAGLYRIVATISVYPAGHDPDDAPVWSALALGDLVQVAAGTSQSGTSRERVTTRHPANKQLLADGVITEDEYAELAAGSPS